MRYFLIWNIDWNYSLPEPDAPKLFDDNLARGVTSADGAARELREARDFDQKHEAAVAAENISKMNKGQGGSFGEID